MLHTHAVPANADLRSELGEVTSLAYNHGTHMLVATLMSGHVHNLTMDILSLKLDGVWSVHIPDFTPMVVAFSPIGAPAEKEVWLFGLHIHM